MDIHILDSSFKPQLLQQLLSRNSFGYADVEALRLRFHAGVVQPAGSPVPCLQPSLVLGVKLQWITLALYSLASNRHPLVLEAVFCPIPSCAANWANKLTAKSIVSSGWCRSAHRLFRVAFDRWLYLTLTTPDDIGQRARQAGRPLGRPRVKGEAVITGEDGAGGGDLTARLMEAPWL